jgi:hypothetical protein
MNINYFYLPFLSPLDARPNLNFNSYDENSKIDRKSIHGDYLIRNLLPHNPCGRTGTAKKRFINFLKLR